MHRNVRHVRARSMECKSAFIRRSKALAHGRMRAKLGFDYSGLEARRVPWRARANVLFHNEKNLHKRAPGPPSTRSSRPQLGLSKLTAFEPSTRTGSLSEPASASGRSMNTFPTR